MTKEELEVTNYEDILKAYNELQNKINKALAVIEELIIGGYNEDNTYYFAADQAAKARLEIVKKFLE